ncbi:MAG: HAMP domain-containing histidine kinase [Coriobacteriales bacterium]|nr:HAMP domain-containing histidine kinase [Coriobacteriales bacterium]
MAGDKDSGRESTRLATNLMRLSVIIALAAVAVTGTGCFLLSWTGHTNEMGVFLAIDAAAFIMIAAAGALLCARHVSKPLQDLNERALKFVDGEYDITFPVDEKAPREIKEVATSLDFITRSTRTAVSKLRAEEQRQLQFVQDVSHELRTPITGIRGNAETLYDDDMPASMRARFIDIIISECDRLTRLVNNLLTLQRLESSTDRVDVKRVDLRKVVDSVVDTLEPLFEERNVRISISGEAPVVLGSYDKLTQVMVNLLENASRFATDHVHVELSGLKGNSVITVSDNGPGFGDTDPARLFDRFYRADASRQRGSGGAGLGLAIVKTIVTSHDGTVEAFNLPGGGACFVVAIPSIAPQD